METRSLSISTGYRNHWSRAFLFSIESVKNYACIIR